MRGGYRTGAGRKKGFAAKNAEGARRILSGMVMKEIEPIGNALISRAKTGDVAAARELFDRGFGKATATNVLFAETSHEELERQRQSIAQILQFFRQLPDR